MTVYVWRNIADKPRVQHHVDPAVDWTCTALCGQRIETSDSHACRRKYFAMTGHRDSLTTIDYDHLPMCKRCARAKGAT